MAGSANQGYLQELNYTSWPDPLVPSYENYKYCIYCTLEEDYEYNYVFYGLYDENTGLIKDAAERAVNVTAYWDDGTAADTFEVNGTYYAGFTTTPQYFVFDLDSADREYWVSEEEGNASTVNIYIFTDSMTEYTITFYDWIDALSTYSWISAGRYINGTYFTMDKRKVDDQKKVVMALQNGKTYTLKAESETDSPYTWGDLTMTSDTTVELAVKGIEFPSDVILTYRYVRAYGYREYSNESYHDITIVYADTKENTNSVNVSIYNSSNIIVNTYLYTSTNSFSYTWTEAAANLSYYSIVTISHGDYGTLIFRNSYAGAMNMSNPFDFSFLGTLPGNASVAELFPSIILIALILLFSPVTSGVGGVIVVVFAAVFTWFGFVTIDVNVLVFAGTLTVIYAILANYKRVTIR